MKPLPLALAFLAGVAIALGLGWLGTAEWRKERAALQVRSGELDELLALQGAELAFLEAEAGRWQLIAQTPDTVRLPAPRPRPTVTPPDYANPEAEITRLAGLADTLWAEGEELRGRIARDSVRLAAYARLVSLRDSQVVLLTAQRDSLRADQDRWQSLAERAPIGAPRLPRALSCAAGAVAGALVGDELSDRRAIVLGSAGLACLVAGVL